MFIIIFCSSLLRYVTYNMANLNNLPFTIDHFTGEIRSTQVLDYETSRRVYFARIRATDWGSPFRRESEIKLQIRLRYVTCNGLFYFILITANVLCLKNNSSIKIPSVNFFKYL